jgi:hypothetical protein
MVRRAQSGRKHLLALFYRRGWLKQAGNRDAILQSLKNIH